MSAPIIWIFVPLIIGIVLVILQRWENGVISTGLFLSIALTLTTWFVPIGISISIGNQTITLSNSLSYGGLQFILTNADRPIVLLLYAFLSFMFGGSIISGVQRRFVPIGLIMVAFVITAIAVEPVIYGILFFQPVVFLSVMLLSPPGHKTNRGVLRFLIFQVIGLVFLLLAAWLLSEGPALLDQPQNIQRVIILLGIGFAFLFAVFPFYTWVTMIAERSHPYSSLLVFALIFGGYTLFFRAILNYYSWLIGDLFLLNEIRFAGVLLIASGGFGAAFQRDLGRLLGYAVMIEVGYGLLAVTFIDSNLFFGLLGSRMIALSVWALGLSIMNSHIANFAFSSVQGMARKFPFAGAAVLIANFSLAGLPLLAGFPLLVTVWKELGSFSAASMIWSFLGSIGLFIGGVRSFAVLIMGPEDLPWDVTRKLSESLFLIFGILLLFFLGVFPSMFGQLYSTLVGMIAAQIP